MNKLTKIIILCLVVCMALSIFVACENTKYGPIGTTEDSDKVAQNNGGLVVQQGKYLYYVNGMDSLENITKPEDNYFGKASVKGSIMKSRVAEDGSLVDTAVVVPKMMYTTASNGGIYVYGEWIYYLSPSTKTDNQSNVLTSEAVAMRTKIDGTETQEIAYLSSNSIQYVFTENALIYYKDNAIVKKGYNASKVDKNESTLASDVTSTLFTEKSTTIFFTKASEDKARQNNNIYAVVNGEVKEITTDATYEGSAEDLSKQFTYKLLKYDTKENALYYSKVSSSSVSSKITYTCGYKFDETFAFDTTKEKKYAVSELSTFVPVSFDTGLLDMSAAELKLYKPIADNAFVNDTQTMATLSATGAKVVSIDSTNMYYILSNNLFKVEYGNKNAVVQKVSEDAINTSWLSISILEQGTGKYMYYIDNTYSYLFRMDLTTFKSEPNNVVFANGEIVSGTDKATLSKDDDGNIIITYVSEDANEEGVTYYRIPKFMTEADKKSYAGAIYEEE